MFYSLNMEWKFLKPRDYVISLLCSPSSSCIWGGYIVFTQQNRNCFPRTDMREYATVGMFDYSYMESVPGEEETQPINTIIESPPL